MNIEENFDSAEVYLEMAREKASRGYFASSLASLVNAYEHTRALIEQTYKLSVESSPDAKPLKMSDKDLREHHDWLQSQGGISSEGFPK